jgi:hypothetical protein
MEFVLIPPVRVNTPPPSILSGELSETWNFYPKFQKKITIF